VFDVYNIQAGDYLMPVYRRALIDRMGLKHVPVLLVDKDLGVGSVDEILQWADGASKIGAGPLREGIVFKQVDGGMTFKAISNAYLLGEK
jgi:ATP-dependent RNA circularization protein (DNA/RNA ligase family)